MTPSPKAKYSFTLIVATFGLSIGAIQEDRHNARPTLSREMSFFIRALRRADLLDPV
jgi:hypothetical protein